MKGLSLIEMMAVLAIISILLMVGVPSLSDYLQNNRLRAVGEQLSSDLKAARVEALNRNRMTTFTMSAKGWSYAVPSAAGFAGYSASPPEMSRAVAIASNQASICFDGTGRVLAADCGGPPVALPQFDVQPVSGSAACQAKGGTMQCLRVTLSALGQARVCNPAAAANSVMAC
ncbi:GspH/FimT family pseudopilin [Cupriavidus sp. 2TAF22]|uniref:GspH/FimT family pseudopilin n=1 Tax=unclassified Cupriavidus TaxID=2640874 RepID=UPI003F8F31C1